MKTKKILYIDMDNVLVDFKSGLDKQSDEIRKKFANNPDEIAGIFSQMEPMPMAVETFNLLAEKFDVYILSTAPWENPTAWSDKLEWVQRYLLLGSFFSFLKINYFV